MKEFPKKWKKTTSKDFETHEKTRLTVWKCGNAETTTLQQDIG